MSIDQKRKAKRTFPALSGNSAAAGAGPRALAPYAVDPARSRGRLLPEPPYPTRSPYARDRDRILHATAFRRLNYKTQVFVYHEGDHYRSRLTHTLEVAQIARALARTLHVDEDLTEALALAHDLGHPPFGHAGERTLDRLMHPHGGFDHNSQSLRIVDVLEERYPEPPLLPLDPGERGRAPRAPGRGSRGSPSRRRAPGRRPGGRRRERAGVYALARSSGRGASASP